MINKFKRTLLCSTLALLTVACSSNIDDEAPTADVESEVQATDAATSEVSAEQPEKAPAAEEVKGTTGLTMPLEKYLDMNSFKDRSYWMPLFLAQTTRELSDEDRLGFMSAEYNSERDQFKKSDLGKAILPEVNKEIDKYKGDIGLKMPFGDIFSDHNPYHNTYVGYGRADNSGSVFAKISLYPYDMETKEFRLSSCRLGNKTFYLRNDPNNFQDNDQNIRLQFVNVAPEQVTFSKDEYLPSLLEHRYDDIYCAVRVEDQEQARKIEGLRVNEKVDAKGFLYYKVTADQNQLIAQPEYAEYTFYNIDTGEDLLSGEFTWSAKDKI